MNGSAADSGPTDGTSDARKVPPVVVGTDGSDHATRAVLWAADEAVSQNRPLIIVYAIGGLQPPSLDINGIDVVLRTGREALDAAAARVAGEHAGIRVSTVLSRDEATESLLEAAGEHGTVVVGSRGLGGFSALLVGSVGLRTAARAKGPVVVVRRVAESAGRVVTAAVRDDSDRSALMYAARTARLHGASLRVVSVWLFYQNVGSMATVFDDPSAVVAEAESKATARMVDPVREAFPDLTVTVETVRAASVAGALLEAATDAGLLVVGAHKPAHRIGHPLGQVTHAVLHHAPCPVAVIPRG